MGKAYKFVRPQPLQNEIDELVVRDDVLEGQRVRCPVEGCPVEYVLYNYLFSDCDSNLEVLLYGLRIEHPNHNPIRYRINEPALD